MKRKYTKCECCPFYAKEMKSGKWECSKINPSYYTPRSYTREEKSGSLCIFNYHSSEDKDNNLKNQILERWINANKGENQ